MLERMNKTSKVLQSKDVNILVASNLLESIKTYLQETGDKFCEYEFKARSMCAGTHYSDEKKLEGKRSDVLLDMMDHHQLKRYFSVKAKSSR